MSNRSQSECCVQAEEIGGAVAGYRAAKNTVSKAVFEKGIASDLRRGNGSVLANRNLRKIRRLWKARSIILGISNRHSWHANQADPYNRDNLSPWIVLSELVFTRDGGRA
jgi:flavin-dependent dehydrogenase